MSRVYTNNEGRIRANVLRQYAVQQKLDSVNLSRGPRQGFSERYLHEVKTSTVMK